MQTTTTDQAFSRGCDLWICTEPNVSAWARRIDWHLNFQIRKSELHQPREVSAEMATILTETEVESPRVEFKSERLMIASGHLLPNRTSVVVPFKADLKSWVHACHALWKDLNEPSARLFLPESVSPDDFRKLWPAGADVEVVASL